MGATYREGLCKSVSSRELPLESWRRDVGIMTRVKTWQCQNSSEVQKGLQHHQAGVYKDLVGCFEYLGQIDPKP